MAYEHDERSKRTYWVEKVSLLDNQKALLQASHLYTFGTTKVDKNKLNERTHQEDVIMKVSTQEVYQLTKGIIDPASIRMFRLFAQGIKSNGELITARDLEQFESKNGKVELNHQDFIKLVYGEKYIDRKELIEPERGFNFYDFNDIPSAIPFVLGSSSLSFDTKKIRYEFINGKPSRINHYQPILKPDNFDNDTSSQFADLANKYIFSIIDPNKQGKRFGIEFENDMSETTLSVTQLKNSMEVELGRGNAMLFGVWTQPKRWELASAKVDARPSFSFPGMVNAIRDFTTMRFSSDFAYSLMSSTYQPKTSFPVLNAFELTKRGAYDTGYLDQNNLDRAFGSRTLDFITDREALNADAKRNGKTDNTFNVSKYYPALDGYRVSNYNESSDPLSVYRNNPNANSLSNLPYRSTEINRNSGWASHRLSIDPLVLDLNGDGVRLSRYSENSILFDIDNDGGSLEQTGWFSATDGVLVRDLNNNGKIDNIAEMFSEYYGGKAGSQGESGEKRYMNGFEALQ